VQTELARITIARGKTFLEVFNALPGPSVRRPSKAKRQADCDLHLSTAKGYDAR
jgi:hypothetical protein